ncbi:MAG: DUF2971 domain-containing protein [Candidatus Tenebribacter davisii]|jgi:hypothetical protein|nr:DUF2971 domain-containing protein [Candidatus Tenebribacter davisii]
MNFNEFVNLDDAIFHYTDTIIFFEHILPEMKLRLSPLENMNDPTEYKKPLFTYMSYGSSKYDRTLLKKAETRLNELKLRMCKIACFCSNVKESTKGYLKARMWTQYGDNHKGVCLVFSKKAINSLINKNYKFEKVKYDIPFPLADFEIEYGELKHQGINPYFEYYFEKMYKKIFFAKVTDYRDESEYRLLKRMKNKNITFDYIDIRSCLEGVIIGDKCHQVYNHIFDHIRKVDHLELIRCKFNPLSGLLEIEPY